MDVGETGFQSYTLISLGRKDNTEPSEVNMNQY